MNVNLGQNPARQLRVVYTGGKGKRSGAHRDKTQTHAYVVPMTTWGPQGPPSLFVCTLYLP